MTILKTAVFWDVAAVLAASIFDTISLDGSHINRI
jgi:hypothetical protein